MRFSIYDVTNKSISLDQEIAYLKNYISLQQLRFEDQVQLSFSVFGAIDGYSIEPFLILPFIENSYKYCVDENTEGWITISINVSDEWLVVKIENSLPENVNLRAIKGSGGVGIINVQRRLALLYPEKHFLTVKNETESFFVSLKIRISDGGH